MMSSPRDALVSETAILNVDDSAAGRYVKSRILTAAGYQVLEAGTGAEALRLAREFHPTLALIDVKLPDIDGLEVCRSLKGDHATASIMVLLISALAVRREDKVTGLEEGADGYLVEPVEPDELLATVRALLRLADSEQRLVLALKAASENERRLDHTEERLRLAVESAHIGTWDLNLDTGENRWDARCKALFGVPPHADVSYETFLSMLHPDDRPGVESHIRQSVDPAGDGSYDVEYRVILERGEERWIRAMGRAFFEERDGARRAVRFTGVALDMTERRKGEAALRAGENRLRLALEAGEMGAWDVDLRTNATAWDAKEFALLGLSVGEVEPSPEEFYRRVHPDDLAVVKRLVEEALVTGALEGEFRVIHRDGQVRWLAAKGHILRDEPGRAVRMVGINFDVTERRQTEERLRTFAGQLEQLVAERTQELVQSQERLRALAAELNIAEQRERRRMAGELHDHLAQMLVLGRLKLSQAKRVPSLARACEELITQTEGVLDDSLQYTRTLVAELSPPVLHDFGLPAALKWLSEHMRRHDLTVSVNAPDRTVERLPEDQAMLLFQSVRELLMNAHKHAQCGRAAVTLEHTDGILRMTVCDDGVGFDLAAAAAAPTASAMSSKFGLFSIRERMRALGGSFEIQSAPGKGTTATLTLPLAPSDEWRVARGEKGSGGGLPEKALRPRSDHSPLTTQHSPRIRVLLVDDHAMVRQGLRSVLDGYADLEVVGEAVDGAEAVRLADRLQPALIVMDINMPRKNGIEATAEIIARWPQMVVIGLSVQANGDAQEAMRKAGATKLLTKEAAVDQLYEAIQETLKKH